MKLSTREIYLKREIRANSSQWRNYRTIVSRTILLHLLAETLHYKMGQLAILGHKPVGKDADPPRHDQEDASNDTL
jgi:hypothetical protein